MPSATEQLDRLVALLGALGTGWAHRDDLIADVGRYPADPLSAGRMLRRDIAALRALGFAVERSEGHHDPSWRLERHERFGALVPAKYCRHCDTWRPLTEFSRDQRRPGAKMVRCQWCNRADGRYFYRRGKVEQPARYRARIRAGNARSAARGAHRAYYRRKRAAGWRKVAGRWVRDA